MVVCTQERGGQCKREGRFALKTDHASVSHTAVPDRSVHETLSSPSVFESLLTLVSLDIELWFLNLKRVEVAFWLPLANVLNLLWRQVLLFVDSSLLVIKKQVRFNTFLFPSVCWNQEFNSLLQWQLKIFNLFLRVATWRSAERVCYCVYKQVVCEGKKKTWEKK